jgi:hypothetical protein
MSLLALFVVGVAEYLLAAWWTQALIARNVGITGTVTFVNVMLWGFVITNLEAGEPAPIIVHGLGCALGAGVATWWAPAREPSPTPASGSVETR